MTKYHAELMKGTVGEAARELGRACLEEFDRWAKHTPADVEGMAFNDDRKAAEHALYEVRTYLDDYLAHRLAIVLTSWGLERADG